MRKIKFSHKYEKMPEDLSINILLGMFITTRKDLGKFFVDYDTSWFDSPKNGTSSKGKYPLPKGKLLVLLFGSGAKPILWTTIRRWTPMKEKYYKKAVDCEFEIVFQ